MSERDEITQVAETYYDSGDADAFYFHVWGGEDIHVGLYETPDEPIRDASRRSVEAVAQRLRLRPEDHVLDLGAGYGGAARWMAKTYGCKVTCINLSEVQNERNRKLSAEQGLADKIEVVHGAFEELPFDSETFDHLWSQDSFLHSGQKGTIFTEAFRVLKPGGHLVFTDPMQADDVPDGVLEPVLARIHLDHLGSFALYRDLAAKAGFEVVAMEDMTKQLPAHYGRVKAELESRRPELEGKVVSRAYLDRMLQGLGHWVAAGQAGHLAWGIIDLRKPA
jgi:sarcosine/dimethylglycine N-methyltransferase